MVNRKSYIACVLTFCSGAAALGYQMVWSRMFATGFGHEMPAMLAIICAFMFGMALGAWAFDASIDRSANPGRGYAVLELVIGIWAFVAAWIIPSINELALKLTGVDPSELRQWLIAFVLPTVALLPATAAMGATFPAMERFLASLGAPRHVALIYAANTFGAVAGILVSTFVIAPKIGFTLTVGLLGVVNVACGTAALTLARRGSRRQETHKTFSGIELPGKNRLLITLFLTGLLGIGYEVVGTRVLSQVLENTIYTFAAVLSIYLLGTAVGASLYQRFAQPRDAAKLLSALLCATTLLCILGVLALSRAQSIYNFARLLGDTTGAVLAAEMLVAIAVFLAPTIAMGATFSHLAQSLRSRGFGVGRAAALNTIGGALAAVLFGVVLLPVIGSKWTLLLGAFAYAALSVQFRKLEVILLAGAAVVAFTLPANLHIATVPAGGKIVAFEEGVMAAVAVVEDARGNRVLRVNNRFQMGGTAAADAEYRQAHIPLLLHPAPHRALFLGIGTGISLGGAALHTNLFVDGVELVPEVVDAMPFFEPFNRSPESRTNFAIHVADARRFVRATTNFYDVIVADLFHPARDGAGALYTLEHFDAIRQRLAPDGLFCQWLPLHQLDDETFALITRTFVTVFPDAQIFLLRFNVDVPVVGLVGTYARFNYDRDWLEKRIHTPELEAELKRLALTDSLRLFGHFIANAAPLFPADEALNTDDHPLVTFRAPHFVYDKNATSYGRLTNLLASASALDANERVITKDEHFKTELSTYAKARDVFLCGLIKEREGDRDAALADYIESARLNPEFTPGYAQCLSISSALAGSEREKARTILRKLMEAQPSRPVAREMLRRLE